MNQQSETKSETQDAIVEMGRHFEGYVSLLRVYSKKQSDIRVFYCESFGMLIRT